MFNDLDAWVRDGTEPPPSRYPHIADGTLVAASALAVKFSVTPYGVYKMELGPEWSRGITQEPPKVVGEYPPLVPQVGTDGNEISGVHMPWLAAPLATWTGWNLRDPSVGFPNTRQNFVGSYIPFAKSEILRLYGDEDEHLGRYAAAALRLLDERFLVPEDLPAILRRGQQEWKSSGGL